MEKCPTGWGSTHMWAGSTPVSSHLKPCPGFKALRSTKPHFLPGGSSSTAGPTGQPPCAGGSCVCGPPSGVPGGELGQGLIRSFLLLKLQGSKDQLPKPSAALFVLGKLVLPWVCPSVPKLS